MNFATYRPSCDLPKGDCATVLPKHDCTISPHRTCNSRHWANCRLHRLSIRTWSRRSLFWTSSTLNLSKLLNAFATPPISEYAWCVNSPRMTDLTPPTPLPCKGRGEPDSPLSNKFIPVPSPCRRGLGRGGEGLGERLTQLCLSHSWVRANSSNGKFPGSCFTSSRIRCVSLSSSVTPNFCAGSSIAACISSAWQVALIFGYLASARDLWVIPFLYCSATNTNLAPPFLRGVGGDLDVVPQKRNGISIQILVKMAWQMLQLIGFTATLFWMWMIYILSSVLTCLKN